MFRQGSYAKIKEVRPISDKLTSVRLSTSMKDRNTGVYTTDFWGNVAVIGAEAAKKASQLKEGDIIILGEISASKQYVEEKKTTYYNYQLYSFEKAQPKGKPAPKSDPDPVESAPDLPF